MEETYVFTKEELDDYLKKNSTEVLKENPEKILEFLDFSIHKQPFNEMARANFKDSISSLFPPDKFDIVVWGKDHNPPHFHVKGPEGWNVLFSIETGKPIKIKHIGKSPKYYKYIVDNVPVWLNILSEPRRKITNKEELECLWMFLNS